MRTEQLQSTRNTINAGRAEYQRCFSELLRQEISPLETPYDRLKYQEMMIDEKLLSFYQKIILISETKQIQALVLPDNYYYVTNDINGEKIPYIKVNISLPLQVELAICKLVDISFLNMKIDPVVMIDKDLDVITKYFFIIGDLVISIQINRGSITIRHGNFLYNMSFFGFLRFIFSKNDLKNYDHTQLFPDQEMIDPRRFLQMINYDSLPILDFNNIREIATKIDKTSYLLGLLSSSELPSHKSYPDWFVRF